MHCTRKITNDLSWVGANDRRLSMFEGVYPLQNGMAYHSYLLQDEKTVLFDTVDNAVHQRFMENLSHALGDRQLDYLVIQHMEPDHSDGIADILAHYPDVKIVCNKQTQTFMKQFYDLDIDARVHLVAEGDILNTGRHTLQFIMAPMVHWPEVMVTYDATDKILFSADAFGGFGTAKGALFADELDFETDCLSEMRRYYSNIVGKYGAQVQALLKKASALEINIICPLHGLIWRENIDLLLSVYKLWSSYTPEKTGVLIVYGSIYGNTENAAEILAFKLREQGIQTTLLDATSTHVSHIVSEAFQWSHLVFASATYNMGVFTPMEALLNELVSHNIQNRTVALIENGTWAATSGKLMRGKLETCKHINLLEPTISLKSGLKEENLKQIDEMVRNILSSISDLW